jgi:molecular chaperone DnaJ
MKKNEAYETLGLQEDASDDDIKKSFRKLAAENHPDKHSGSLEAEDKFKKINQAYQILSGKERADDENNHYSQSQGYNSPFPGGINLNDIFNIMNGGSSPGGFSDFFNNKNARAKIDLSDINVQLNLTFEETVLGGSRKVSFKRRVYCEKCEGFGRTVENKKGCNKCNGKGNIQQKYGNGMFIRIENYPCVACSGTGFIGSPCPACNSAGFKLEEVSVNLKIPPIGGNAARLGVGGKGHTFKNQTGNVFVILSPETNGKDQFNMEVDGRNVYARVDVNLDKLLFGGTISVPIIGRKDEELTIPELTKPGTSFTLSCLGVKGDQHFPTGDHIITVNVKYPDKNKLTESLRDELTKLY